MDEQENAYRSRDLLVIDCLHDILVDTYNVVLIILVHGIFGQLQQTLR